VLQQLQLDFSAQIPVPNVQTQPELAAIMKQSGIFADGDVNRALTEIEETTGSKSINVGISSILLAIQPAKQDEDKTGRFAEVLSEMCADNAAL
jgi:vesicle-fusing ATPase